MRVNADALEAVLLDPGCEDGLKDLQLATKLHGWLSVEDVAEQWLGWLRDAVNRYPAGTVFRITASEPPIAKKVSTWLTWRGDE